MTDTDGASGPLVFSACFPRRESFASTAADLASRLADSTGWKAGVAGEARAAVDAAFRETVALERSDAETVDLVLRASDEAFSAQLTCGGVVVLRWLRTRVA
ncbi:MAG TPA: hypothetical protein PLN93_04435 [Vicinamibacterales bacterium]|nr:hypothetical protein [Vicinamibacterales bacterium]HPK71170.1 hypothetical protein [Vicinamibacterales bacterium]